MGSKVVLGCLVTLLVCSVLTGVLFSVSSGLLNMVTQMILIDRISQVI